MCPLVEIVNLAIDRSVKVIDGRSVEVVDGRSVEVIDGLWGINTYGGDGGDDDKSMIWDEGDIGL